MKNSTIVVQGIIDIEVNIAIQEVQASEYPDRVRDVLGDFIWGHLPLDSRTRKQMVAMAAYLEVFARNIRDEIADQQFDEGPNETQYIEVILGERIPIIHSHPDQTK